MFRYPLSVPERVGQAPCYRCVRLSIFRRVGVSLADVQCYSVKEGADGLDVQQTDIL